MWVVRLHCWFVFCLIVFHVFLFFFVLVLKTQQKGNEKKTNKKTKEGLMLYLESKACKMTWIEYGILCLSGRLDWVCIKQAHIPKKKMILFKKKKIKRKISNCQTI